MVRLNPWGGRKPPSQDQFFVKFWGVRGSIACAGPEVQRYGGNTSCLEIVCSGRRLVFDGGTGLRYLGEQIEAEGQRDIDIFLTHSHIDHVVGLPFFSPLFCEDTTCRIWSGHLEGGMSTHKAIGGLMNAPLFPVAPEIFKARVLYNDFSAGDTLEPHPDIVIRTAALNHPNGATGYRVDHKGKSIAYVTDTEHFDDGLDEAILGLIDKADIFIYDATYTDEEYPASKGFGHSTWQEGVRLADAAGVGVYVAFHHDPSHDDDFMDQVARDVAAARAGSIVAREGESLFP